MKFIDKASKNYLPIPFHTLHIMQSYKVSVYEQQNHITNWLLIEWDLSNRGREITNYNLLNSFSTEFSETFSLANNILTGIESINIEEFLDQEFQAVDVCLITNTKSNHWCK